MKMVYKMILKINDVFIIYNYNLDLGISYVRFELKIHNLPDIKI